MNQLLSNKLGKMISMAAMLVAFLVMGAIDAGAQQSANNGVNPMQMEAASIGITAYSLGSLNATTGITALENWINAQKSNQDVASSYTRFTYAYYALVVSDVQNLSIAPEIALITNLSKATKQVSGITQQNMVTAYNTAVSSF